MRLLLDVNVLLDVLLRRDPWAEPAAQLLARVELGQASGFVAGHTLTTVHYVVSKIRNRDIAGAAIADLLRILDIVPIEKVDFSRALALPVSDFEDAVQAAAALKIGADYIVTRDKRGFRSLPVSAASPTTVLSLL